eukprot:TRINITY_DN22425_c0_g1_i1.p1 TRINITY_DN22425_c0_g1~~TRINITY_DN22425_c0_g1_i1.p1  ORF type:complete len:492 (-),score=84.13 TRINITY_DN22425_c0_g1_i1:81-1556(-)
MAEISAHADTLPADSSSSSGLPAAVLPVVDRTISAAPLSAEVPPRDAAAPSRSPSRGPEDGGSRPASRPTSRTASRSRGMKRRRRSPRHERGGRADKQERNFSGGGRVQRRSGRTRTGRGPDGTATALEAQISSVTAAGTAETGLVSGPLLRVNKTIFSYGNYDQYYSQRHDRYARIDARVEALLQHRGTDFFSGKAVLDMGCNSGFITLLVAALGASHSEGVDIDLTLISKALRRLRRIKKDGCTTLPELQGLPAQAPSSGSSACSLSGASGAGQKAADAQQFPISCVHSRGVIPYHAKPLQPGALASAVVAADAVGHREGQGASPGFPHNIEFRSENVLVSEVEERRGLPYDVVLCLKLTKWVHLHWGDDGLKLLLHKCYRLLREGGLLVLEAQEWSSYFSSNKHLTPHTRQNRSQLELQPSDFPDYLVREVGFEKHGSVMSANLKRPLLLFKKVLQPKEPALVMPPPPPRGQGQRLPLAATMVATAGW